MTVVISSQQNFMWQLREDNPLPGVWQKINFHELFQFRHRRLFRAEKYRSVGNTSQKSNSMVCNLLASAPACQYEAENQLRGKDLHSDSQAPGITSGPIGPGRLGRGLDSRHSGCEITTVPPIL